jgi:hypothetical protein
LAKSQKFFESKRDSFKEKIGTRLPNPDVENQALRRKKNYKTRP